MLELVKKASIVISDDVLSSLENALQNESMSSLAYETLDTIIKSAGLSENKNLPICQDTGSIFAVIRSDAAVATKIRKSLIKAIRELTRDGILRQNCVNSLTGKNTGDNTGEHVPQIHFEPYGGQTQVSLMLKGGGSENVSTQYSLPDVTLNAGRDLEGVRRCVLDAVFRAQGKGCAPGILGVCIGGDRASGYHVAKEQLFRRLDDTNPDEVLAGLEKLLLEEANNLGIGPMGLGGKTTLLGVKIAGICRHPASYFVTISYSCWATRRYTVVLNETGGIVKWI
ncbi:MAG TPA: fumarate hydratase [Desulfomonilia bacterium]